jgi:hypothetical protein
MDREEKLGIILPHRGGQRSPFVPPKKIEHLIAAEWAGAIQSILRDWKVDRHLQSHRMAKYTWTWCAQQALNVLRASKD